MDREQALIEKFVERINISHYRDQLKTEADQNKRKILQRLLAEEEAKQAHHRKEEKEPQA